MSRKGSKGDEGSENEESTDGLPSCGNFRPPEVAWKASRGYLGAVNDMGRVDAVYEATQHAAVGLERKKTRVSFSAPWTHTSTCTPRGKKDETDVKMRRVGIADRWWG